MYRPMPPTKAPEPKKVAKKGALMFWNQAASPAEKPMVIQFYLPIIISMGISISPM